MAAVYALVELIRRWYDASDALTSARRIYMGGREPDVHTDGAYTPDDEPATESIVARQSGVAVVDAHVGFYNHTGVAVPEAWSASVFSP